MSILSIEPKYGAYGSEDFGFGAMGWNKFRGLFQEGCQYESEIQKALTVGSGIVDAGATGGATLRTQFIYGGLERASYLDEDCVGMKMIPKEKVYSNTIEQTFNLAYGAIGNGFIGELGNDSNNGISASDDNFLRQVQIVKYMAARRDPGFVAQQVRVIEDGDPVQVSEMDAMLELLGKANRGLYYADSQANSQEFNGLQRQIRAWVIAHTERQGICFDCGGQPLSEELLRDAQKAARRNWGRFNKILCGVDTRGDTQKSLYPKERFDPDSGRNSFGLSRDEFDGDWKVTLIGDPMLLPGAPLAVDGARSNGAPVTTGDTGAPSFAVTPFVSCAAGTPGTGFFLNNADGTQNSAPLTTAPALPSGNTALLGYNQNRLPAGTSYYGIAPVYDGLEGPIWIYGAASAGTVTSATAITITSTNSVVTVRVDNSTPAVTGLGSTWTRSRLAYRIYRYDGSSAPTAISQFQYLATIGSCTGSGDAYYYDNGVDMPGTTVAYGITERKNNKPQWAFLSLLPMVKRQLPNTLTTDPFGMLLFGTPFLRVPNFHMEFRNIGPYKG